MDFNNLLTAQLKSVEGTEVVVSKVSVPPDTQLPKHWHPGEEFAYILGGKLILWQEDGGEKIYSQGEVAAVPLKTVHTIRTENEGVTVLVFRVHEQGQPERFLVE